MNIGKFFHLNLQTPNNQKDKIQKKDINFILYCKTPYICTLK
ncbi:hypothetical protein FLJC2902T_01580 [Flavobacterium limnosediminis JC2902]|uniref:Uncharacterized protein n=1 Tax=Flavobacterium limnosediminis JC2902 TaxID=1341181 RepID=V6SZ64_9FLAO|nr:hypothetical protein FLJC2902T_01580 [Flavobacterium limnosediminis JC2902]